MQAQLTRRLEGTKEFGKISLTQVVRSPLDLAGG